MKRGLLLGTVAMLVAGGASATTYYGYGTSIETNSGTVAEYSYRIETDGALGVLGAASILGGKLSYNFNGNHSSENLPALMSTLVGGLTATATTLVFNFSGNPAALVMFGTDSSVLCFNGVDPLCDTTSPDAFIANFTTNVFIPLSTGESVIATTTPAPEPATFALFGLGILAVGGRRRAQA